MAKLNHLMFAGAAALSSLALPAASHATTVVGPAATVSPCTNFTFDVTIISCAGGYSGNMLQGSLTDATGLAAVAALGGSGGTYLETKLDSLDSNTGIINFNTLLKGLTIFGIHAGGAGDGGEGTFFFKFDAGAGTDVVTITDRLNSNATGLSNAALFTTGGGVPEPATWGMMILGIGLAGAAIRRQRQTVNYKFA